MFFGFLMALAIYPFGLKEGAPLAMYPFGLKGCKKMNFLTNAPFGWFSLAMYPSGHFFLKALFLRGARQNPAGSGASRLKGA